MKKTEIIYFIIIYEEIKGYTEQKPRKKREKKEKNKKNVIIVFDPNKIIINWE